MKQHSLPYVLTMSEEYAVPQGKSISNTLDLRKIGKTGLVCLYSGPPKRTGITGKRAEESPVAWDGLDHALARLCTAGAVMSKLSDFGTVSSLVLAARSLKSSSLNLWLLAYYQHIAHWLWFALG